MRYIIQNILKENHRPTIGKTVYLIMDKSGKYVFTKFLTRGTYWVTMENYGNGDGYQSYTDIIFKNRKEAQEFLDLVIYCFQHQDRICSYKLEKDDQRNSFNPNDWEVVEYIQGLMPKDDTEIFDNLTESEDSGGPNEDGWESVDKLNNKTFQEFYINQRKNAEGVVSILPQPQLDRYKPKVVEYVMGFFRKDSMSNVFDQLTESKEGIGSKRDPHRGDFILAKKAIFVDGKDKATTMGNMYEIKKIRNEYGIKNVIFINDFDAEHTVTPTNHFFEEYFEYVPREYKEGLDNTDTLFDLTYNFFNINESEFDDLEWANDVVTASRIPSVGVVYRVNLPKDEKAIIDILIADMDENWVHDNTRAIIIDPETIVDPKRFLRDYNRNEQTPLDRVIELLEEGHWRPIPKEMSLFRQEDFDPNDPIYIPRLTESEEDNFEWVDELPEEEPFHKILIQNDERDFGLKFSGVDRILFNPSVEIGSRYFNDVVYWLEDRDYYPDTLQLDGETSYIEIVKRRHAKGIRNGKFKVGPVLSDQELYKLSQENTRPNWNGNIWYEQFMKEFKVRN